jgi:hypothetical protein
MSFANQPARLLISSDDLDYGTGNSFTITLPETIVGAKKADLIRAVIPNTGYPIPSYQSNFYFYNSGIGGGTTLASLVLNTNQYFDSITGGTYPLISVLNATATAQALPLTFSYNGQTARIVVQATSGTMRVAPASVWTTPFALNTRLGFQDAQSTTLVGTPLTAQIMPNIIRSKCIYVLCNVVLNDSISSDGLRTAIAKIPTNSTFGGLTLYSPPKIVWNRLVQGAGYTTITIQLLDDQYQPYPLNTEEFCELEIAFKYDEEPTKKR